MTFPEAAGTPAVDMIQPFQIEGPGLRGRMVRVGPALDKALSPHGYPASVGRLLSETVATALILASSLKYDGIFTLQITGDGPVGTLMADVTSDGAFRCYAGYDAVRLAALEAETSDATLPHYLGAGRMAFTVDQGPDMERYQGVTEVTGATMAECAHAYFRQSEQLQTAMVILTDVENATAGALMLQQLPEQQNVMDEDTEEDWRRAVVLMSSVRQEELLDEGLAPADLLYRLFHEDGVRLFDALSIRNECRCSVKKVKRTLKSFPREEIEGMREDDGIVRVTCEFCKTDYTFDDDALDSLYSSQDKNAIT